MKKIASFTVMTIVSIAVATLCAQSNDKVINDDGQVAHWETLAEKGDTAAMHRLIEFYDQSSAVFVEVAEVIEPDGTEWTDEEVDSLNLANKSNVNLTKHYSERLEYWLSKGIAINDPVALATKGFRLYYEDEKKSIAYLSKVANAGNAQAALFCGSACLNQGKGEDAFRYLSLAYRLGAPSAGWHLAMCYSAGIGTEPNREKAVEVMRHAAILNYPEAVSEMRRIEPDNEIWKLKADSIEIDFPDFPIIPDE